MKRAVSDPAGPLLAVLVWAFAAICARGQVRDGGIDPRNLGKGDWIYSLADATNHLGGNVSAVSNQTSLLAFYKHMGLRYVIVKAGTGSTVFDGSFLFPQFTSNLVQEAHAAGLAIFGYTRSWGKDVPGEAALADYVFGCGADGFVLDAEAEWESFNSWIGTNGPALAWQLCSTVRSNWPTRFLAHAPFPIISLHPSFPYKEFGYWCDAVMPQVYHAEWAGVKNSPSGAINWMDLNWHEWQNSLTGTWTNAIKPLAPVNHVYGPKSRPAANPIPNKDVTEFLDYLNADPYPATPGGYQGASFWRADLHGAVQWAAIQAATVGVFPGVVKDIVLDDPNAIVSGAWTSVRTFDDGVFCGGKTDTNSFGTNYLAHGPGNGSAWVEFRPVVVVPGYYNVYAWHPQRPDASARVPVVINYDGGSSRVLVNQQTNSGNWSWLGRFNFAAGTNGSARITDAVEPSRTALADAMKWVFVGPPLRAPPTR